MVFDGYAGKIEFSDLVGAVTFIFLEKVRQRITGRWELV